MSNAADNPRPPSATHVQWACGSPTYYKRVEVKHMNQVSEEWQIKVHWHYWDWTLQRWVMEGPGFSSRHLKELNIK